MASDEKRPSFWACAEEAEKRVSQWPAWKREAASATLVSRPEMRQARKEDHVSKRKPAITIVATVTEPALGGEAVICRAALPAEAVGALVTEAREAGHSVGEWLAAIICERYRIEP